MRLEDVRVIVTGAGNGLGRHFALEFVKCGASVAAGDIDITALEQLRSAAGSGPGKLWAQKLNVSQETSVMAFMNEASSQIGTWNTLVNNAGILRDGLLAEDAGDWIKKLPTVQWKQVIDTNLTGAYLMSREFVAQALSRKIKEGVIVNISSMSRVGNPGQSNYAASKAALDACTRTWALELASYGVRVGGIAPGLVDTPMLRHISEEALRTLISAVPLKRIGTPHDVWLALKFIIECTYFTGSVLEVDGGSQF